MAAVRLRPGAAAERHRDCQRNEALSAALQIKVEFTQAELEGFALCGLQSGAFVRAGGAWFEPHTPRWRGVGSARSPHAALRKAAQ